MVEYKTLGLRSKGSGVRTPVTPVTIGGSGKFGSGCSLSRLLLFTIRFGSGVTTLNCQKITYFGKFFRAK